MVRWRDWGLFHPSFHIPAERFSLPGKHPAVACLTAALHIHSKTKLYV